MNNDIFFLANSEIIQKSKKNEIIETLNSFIEKEKEKIIQSFIGYIENKNFDNQYIKDIFYKYIKEFKFLSEYKNVKEDNYKEKSIDNEKLKILNKTFLKFKQNRQKSIMESFQQKKTVQLYQRDINKSQEKFEIKKNNNNIENNNKNNDNENDKKKKKLNKKNNENEIIQGKTLDLTGKI